MAKKLKTEEDLQSKQSEESEERTEEPKLSQGSKQSQEDEERQPAKDDSETQPAKDDALPSVNPDATIAERREQTLKLATTLGIDLDGSLKDRISQYCKVMVEQDVQIVKNMYLPALFDGKDMSVWSLVAFNKHTL